MNHDRKAQLEQWRQQKKTVPLQKPIISQPRSIPRPPSQVQQRQQLNQTNGGFVAKSQQAAFKQPIATTQSNPTGTQVSNLNQMKTTKSRVECEIEVIFSHYKKNIEMQDKNVPAHVRNAHDADKWKKKFFIVFNREKVVDFTGNPQLSMEMRNLILQPTGLTREGKKILSTNSKFWILYVKLIQEKISNINRCLIRDYILKTFRGSPDMSLIKQELGQLLQISDEYIEDKENEQPLPHFGKTEDKEEKKEEINQETEQQFIQEEQIVQKQEEITNQNYKSNIPLESFTRPPNNDVSIIIVDQQEQVQNNENANVNVIPTPSQDFVVRAPIQLSHLSIMETPNFKQEQLDESQVQTQEEKEEENVYKQDNRELNNRIADLTFNDVQYIVVANEQQQNEELISELSEPNKDMEIENQVVIDQQKIIMQDQEQQDQDQEQEIEQEQEQLIEIQLIDQQEECQQEVDQQQQEIDQVINNDNNQNNIINTTLIVDNEQQQQIHTEEKNNCSTLDNEVIEEQQLEYEQQMIFEEREEDKEIQDEMLKQQKSARMSKKRKRSLSPISTPTSMNLRSKNKKRKLNENVSPFIQQDGASYLRYEILEKKDGKFLVPVRYSIRNQEADNLDQYLSRQILNNEVSFIYEPNEMEELFAMDKTTQEIQKLLKQKIEEIQKGDIMEVVDADVSEKGNFSLIKIKPECREKYGGHEQIAAALRRLSASPRKRDGYMRDMMDHLFQEKKMRELMLANVSEEALEFIKKSRN